MKQDQIQREYEDEAIDQIADYDECCVGNLFALLQGLQVLNEYAQVHYLNC